VSARNETSKLSSSSKNGEKRGFVTGAKNTSLERWHAPQFAFHKGTTIIKKEIYGKPLLGAVHKGKRLVNGRKIVPGGELIAVGHHRIEEQKLRLFLL